MNARRFLFLTIVVVLSASCSLESPSVPREQIPSVEIKDKVTEDHDTQFYNPIIDILFVIDNSGSMYTHQQNLATNMNLFMAEFFKNSMIDYHIGVVTTDMEGGWGGSVPCCGKLAGSPKYVERSTPNVTATLAKTIQDLGTSGSAWEKSFAPIIASFSTANQAWNAGFYRKDAFLAVVFLVDSEDQSAETAKDVYDLLLREKRDPEKILSYGAIVPVGVQGCERDSWDEPVKIEEFLGMTSNAGKNIFSLCDPQFGQKVADMAKEIAKKVGGRMKLNRAPASGTIRVTYGTQEIPNDFHKGWTYSPADNSIYFGEGIEWSTQAPGAQVKIDFVAARYDQK